MLNLEVQIKPVFAVSEEDKSIVATTGWPSPKIPTEAEIKNIHNQLKDLITEENVIFLPPSVIRDIDSFEKFKTETPLSVDLLLIGFYGPTSGSYGMTGDWALRDKLLGIPIPRIDLKDITKERINCKIRAIRAKRGLQKTKALVIGTLPSYSVTKSAWNPIYIMSRLGVTFHQLEMSRLWEEYRNVQREDIGGIIEEDMKFIQEMLGPTMKQVDIVERLYLALKKLLKKKKANAITINCATIPDTDLVPCLPFGKLISEGIPAGCEADLNALSAMIVLMYISGKPAVMGNLWCNLDDNTITISHCVVPSKLVKEGAPYILRDFHGSGKGVTGYGNLSLGEHVTILAINPEISKFLIVKGITVSVEDAKEKRGVQCRFSIDIEVENARRVADERFAHHHVLVYGDYVKEVQELANMLGLEPIML